MKDTACEETVLLAQRWRLGAFYFWAAFVVLATLSLSPALLGQPPALPSFIQAFRIYLLYAILLGLRYMTFTHRPDINSETDAFRKLFTSLSAFHALIAVSALVYPVLYREAAIALGYSRGGSSFESSLACGVGLLNALLHLLRFEYTLIFYDQPYGRVQWLGMSVPGAFLKAAALSLLTFTGLSLAWALGRGGDTVHVSAWVQLTASTQCVFLDHLLTSMLNNFLAKPVYLGDRNSIDEQLSVSGLTTNKVDLHYFCFQDLLQVSMRDHERRHMIMDRTTEQWEILFHKGLEYIRDVSQHVSSYAVQRGNAVDLPAHLSGWQERLFEAALAVYYLFNQPFQVTFRNELFEKFTMATLACKTLTNFVVNSDLREHMTRDRTIGTLLEALMSAVLSIRQHKARDSRLNSDVTEAILTKHVLAIKKAYAPVLNNLSIKPDLLSQIHNAPRGAVPVLIFLIRANTMFWSRLQKLNLRKFGDDPFEVVFSLSLKWFRQWAEQYSKHDWLWDDEKRLKKFLSAVIKSLKQSKLTQVD